MLNIIRGLAESGRTFPYEQYLITSFPFYAILFVNGKIDSVYSLILLLPFVSMMAAIFMYNTICDAAQDPKHKNPITRGQISKRYVTLGMYLCVAVTIIFILLLYHSPLSYLVALFYSFLCFSYCGIKLRFKETILGPPIASLLLFCGAPLLIMVEFGYFNLISLLLLVGIFFIYFAHEVKHTTIEYEMDKAADCKTFAVTVGKKNSLMIEYLLLLIGFILLLYSSTFLGTPVEINVIFLILFLVSFISTILYGRKNNFILNNDTFYNVLPYISTKIYYITYACVILSLPALIIFFIIWILFTDKYL